MTAAIEIRDLGKRYGSTEALTGLTLTVEAGEVFGFLGPNGAGKSTTIRCLLDLIRPTTGLASVLGFDCQRDSMRVRERTGYLPGDVRLYPGLRGRETVELVAGLRGQAVDWAYTQTLSDALALDLGGHAGSYSKGNRQKLGLLLALFTRPAVLLLDEPTSGLDPIVQRTVWDVLRREADRGVAVFFSSHVMSEVDQICERVAVLRSGRLVTVESIGNLKGRSVRHVEVSFAGAAPPTETFRAAGVTELRREGATLEFEVTGEIDPLLKALAPYHVLDLRTEQPSLDEVLLAFYRGDES